MQLNERGAQTITNKMKEKADEKARELEDAKAQVALPQEKLDELEKQKELQRLLGEMAKVIT